MAVLVANLALIPFTKCSINPGQPIYGYYSHPVVPQLTCSIIMCPSSPTIACKLEHMAAARSFGSAVLSGVWSSHYVFWLGPISGAIIASLTHEICFRFTNLSNQNRPVIPGGGTI